MRCLLAFLSIYFLFIAGFAESVNFSPWNIYSAYTLFLLTCIAGLAVAGVIKASRESKKLFFEYLSIQKLILFGIIALLWGIIRYEVFVRGLIWYDEATQFIPYWFIQQAVDSVTYAAAQQQMPLDYFTSYAFLKLFGASPDIMLFHSRIYGILSCGVFFLILLRLKFNWFVLLIAMTVFLSEMTILRYSSEARPIGLVILLGLINFYYFDKYLKSSDNHYLLGLLPSSLLLMLSTGLQPLLHIFLITVFFMFKSNNFEKRRALNYNFVLSILLSLPLTWNIYKSTAGFSKNFKSQDLLSTFLDLFKKYEFENLVVFRNIIADSLMITHSLILLIVLIVSIYSINELYYKKRHINLLNWSYLLMFPPLFTWIWSIMDWPLFPRYFAVWTSVSIVLLFQMFNDAVVEYSEKLNIVVKSSLGILLSYLTIAYSIHQNTLYQFDKNYADVRKIFTYESRGANSIYFHLPLAHPQESGMYFNYTGPLYNTENRYFWTDSRKSFFHTTPKYIRNDLQKIFDKFEEFNFEKAFDLFLIVDCGYKIINPFCQFKPENVSIDSAVPTVVVFGGASKAFIYRNQSDVIKVFDQIFSNIESQMDSSVWLFEYYIFKIDFLIEIKKFNEASLYINKMLEILDRSEFDYYFNKEQLKNDMKRFQNKIIKESSI